MLAKAVEFSAAIESSDDNNLFADNGIAESERSFANGTLTINTDDLEQAASALILGITASTLTIGEDTVSELIFDDDMSPPDLGFGIIIKKKKSGIEKHRAVVFPRIKFNIPEDAATTQGETIEWQTPSLEATIMRDDTAKRRWKREATFDSEAEAEIYIKHLLNIA
ncbi:MAG: phage tail protein [Bacillota bacterium]